MTSSWREYWNGDSPIYVSERHKILHDRRIAGDVAALIPRDGACVLDHGCGEARSAGEVARRCAKLFLCDGAPSVRAGLIERFGGDGRIVVLAPEELAGAIPDGSLDMVVANSLLQYLSRQEFSGLLALWREKLRPAGRLVLGDVIPPGVGVATDAWALLAFAWRGGFLFSALAGLARTAVSEYRKLRGALGLTTYPEAEMLSLLDGAGFSATRRRPNIGHNRARMTFVAERRG